MGLRIAYAVSVMKVGAEDGLADGMEHVLNTSNAHVPLEYGDLEASGVASVDGLEGAVSYDTPYAVEQHENLNYRHDEGRTAKYLENAMNSEKTTVRKLIADGVRRAVGD